MKGAVSDQFRTVRSLRKRKLTLYFQNWVSLKAITTVRHSPLFLPIQRL